MEGFTNKNIDFDVLRKRAYNMRWAEQEEDVIPLTAADHDFPADPRIVEALQKHIEAGYFTYTPHRGNESFKVAISKALKERKNEEVDPKFILPVDSAARGMDIIASAFLKPGDEVIVFDPVDFLFRTSMEHAGAKVILFPSNLKEDCVSLEGLEDYITPNVKMVGFCNPHNPLGMLYKKEDLDYLLRLSEKYGFYIMNDEIWSDMIYPECKFTSLLEFGAERNARTLSVYGFSKTFGLAGLRIGCIYAMNQECFDKLLQASMVDTTIGGIDILAQVAGEAALGTFDRVDQFRQQVAENRDYALSRIEKMPGIKCHKPQATFVIFPDVTGTGMNPVELVDLLKEKYRVALVPGGARFFGPGSEGHIRICMSTSHEILEEGLNRLEQCLNDIAAEKNT